MQYHVTVYKSSELFSITKSIEDKKILSGGLLSYSLRVNALAACKFL